MAYVGPLGFDLHGNVGVQIDQLVQLVENLARSILGEEVGKELVSELVSHHDQVLNVLVFGVYQLTQGSGTPGMLTHANSFCLFKVV